MIIIPNINPINSFEMKDINDLKDIKLMVDTFYCAVRNDDFIGPIFLHKIGDNWDRHLETMYRFWQTVLLHQMAYKGSPFHPHRKLPIKAEHFERWLYHFNTSMDLNFSGVKAEEAKWRAGKMAEMFMHKLNTNQF